MKSTHSVESELEFRARDWHRQYSKSVLLDGLVRWVASWTGLWLAAALADSFFSLPEPARWAAWSLLAAFGAVGVFYFVVLPLRREGRSEVLRRVAKLLPDVAPYLLSSWELRKSLGGPNTSETLARKHLEQTESRLSSLPEAKLFSSVPGRRRLQLLAAVAGAWLAAAPWLYWSGVSPWRLLAPWNEISIESLVRIEPGSARLAWGSPVAVSVSWRKPTPESSLELWLKSPDGPWVRASWDHQAADGSSYQIPSLVKPLRYQLRWRRRTSRVYLLEPAPYPSLEEGQVRIHPPGSGAGAIETISLQEGAELSALKGSWVVVSGRSGERLSRARLIVSSLAAPIDFKVKGASLEAGFPVSQDLEFYFDLASADGLSDPHPIHYRLKAADDQPPTAEILSPAFDVDSSNKEALPITYEVRDDYGVATVELVYTISHVAVGAPSPNIGSGAAGKEHGLPAERRVPIAKFDPPRTDSVGEFKWDLSSLPMGESVDFWIRAADASAMGPQIGLSPKRHLRVIDFEAVHSEMEKRWMEAENRLSRIEKREGAASNALEALTHSSKDAQSLEREARAAQQGLDQEWNEAARALSQTADAASQDPYANPGLADELRALADELSAVGAEQQPKADRQTADKDWSGAAKSRAALESEARKAGALMNKGHGLQAMQDLWNNAQMMDERSSDLAGQLSKMAESGGTMSAEQSRALQEALKQLDEQMKALADTIQSMPKPQPGSPEEKRQKTIVVPLGSAQRIADALQQALRRGDLKEAARLAQRLSEELSRVRQALAEAAAAAGGEGGEEGPPPSAEMEALMGAWQQALDGQARSLSQARKLDESTVQSKLEEQKKLLRELAERQKAAIADAHKLGSVVPPDIEVSMRVVLAEFIREEIKSAPQLLSQIAARLQIVEVSTQEPQLSRVAALEKEERAILAALEKGVPPPPMSSAQAAEASSARQTQSGVRAQTADLEKKLRDLADRTSSIQPKTLDSVSQAQVEQSQAEGNLSSHDSSGAVSHEEKALEHLDRGLKEMSDALERQRKMEQAMQGSFSPGRGGAGRMRRSASGGSTGFVPLPSAQEYEPSPEIRKELKKSVQEPRPKAYDKTIKDYFKRISE